MYFSEPVIFELPVRARVAKFIRVKLQDAAGRPQPMYVHPQALGPGLFLWGMAQSEKIALHQNYLPKTGSREKGSTRRQLSPDGLDAMIGLGINEFHYTRHQHLLSYPEQLVFCNMVDYMILNELVQFIENRPRLSPITCIKQFCDHFDFSEDDFAEQTLRMMYLRHRQRVGSYQFAPEISRNFQFMPVPAAMAA